MDSKKKKTKKKKVINPKTGKVIKNPYGRPTVPDPFVNDEKLNELQELASIGMTMENIAHYYGMSKTHLYKLMERNSNIKKTIDLGKSKGISEIADTLMRKAKEGDNTCMIFYLKTQAGWRDMPIEHIHTGKITHEVELEAIKRIDSMTEEQRQKRLEELEKLEAMDKDIIDVEVKEIGPGAQS